MRKTIQFEKEFLLVKYGNGEKRLLLQLEKTIDNKYYINSIFKKKGWQPTATEEIVKIIKIPVTEEEFSSVLDIVKFKRTPKKYPLTDFSEINKRNEKLYGNYRGGTVFKKHFSFSEYLDKKITFTFSLNEADKWGEKTVGYCLMFIFSKWFDPIYKDINYDFIIVITKQEFEEFLDYFKK